MGKESKSRFTHRDVMIIESDLNVLGSESIDNSFSTCGLSGGE